MKGITPFGIYTNHPEESRNFYRSVLGIERIWSMSAAEQAAERSGVVLRLESPRLELFASELRLTDRRVNDRVPGLCQLVLYPGDLLRAAQTLEKAGVDYRADYTGRLYFEDLNGIQWEMRETPGTAGLT
ncbi:MAG TPA: VOC family protein [Candidatus Ozemobacteraceae bacterium]|nr:VOC family protein [Candidatus Ozemobacteraceae bacterium]